MEGKRRLSIDDITRLKFCHAYRLCLFLSVYCTDVFCHNSGGLTGSEQKCKYTKHTNVRYFILNLHILFHYNNTRVASIYHSIYLGIIQYIIYEWERRIFFLCQSLLTPFKIVWSYDLLCLGSLCLFSLCAIRLIIYLYANAIGRIMTT